MRTALSLVAFRLWKPTLPLTPSHKPRSPMRASMAGLLTAVFWLALCHPAGARIGETLDQVVKRYGRCLKTDTAANGQVYKMFTKGGVKILVHFYESRV